ncbi:hypothetical protein [Azospirillum palustre]
MTGRRRREEDSCGGNEKSSLIGLDFRRRSIICCLYRLSGVSSLNSGRGCIASGLFLFTQYAESQLCELF